MSEARGRAWWAAAAAVATVCFLPFVGGVLAGRSFYFRDLSGHFLPIRLFVLEGLRHALIAVVERGTAAASRHEDLQVAGKTGTAQNPHGKDHGWFIGFAPADKPELVVGGIMEFAEHGTVVAPYVVAALRRYVLGPDTSAKAAVKLRVIVPDDSAPRALELDPDSAAAQAAAESLRTEGEKPRP